MVVSGALPTATWVTIHDLDVDVHHDAGHALLCLLDSSGHLVITTSAGEEIRIRRTPRPVTHRQRHWLNRWAHGLNLL